MLAGDRCAAARDHAGEISDGTRVVQPASGLVERVTCDPSLGAQPMNALSPTYHSRVPERAAPRVLIAPQSFKGSADAVAVAAAIAKGVKSVWPDAETIEMPLADGGEGTVRALVRATGGQLRTATVHDPLLREIQAEWGVLGDRTTAVVEMAAANGLPLLREDERDPRITSTRGTGELILAAAMSGAHRIVIGIGGSATNDGGAGMARAFGYRFLDRDGVELPEGGAALARLARIDGQTDPRLIRASIDVACDVRNPLLGPEGASAIFGPQKGATPEMVRELDAALTRYADVVERHVGRPIRDVPGAGAAGGLGAGLLAFLDARLVSGAQLVLDAVGFEHSLGGASLVITGEGRIDGQSVYGKLTHAVTVAARHRGVPVVAIAGTTGEGVQAMRDAGIEAIETLAASAEDRPAAMRDPLPRIERAAARLVQTRGEPPSL
jgi:glycerate kinase